MGTDRKTLPGLMSLKYYKESSEHLFALPGGLVILISANFRNIRFCDRPIEDQSKAATRIAFAQHLHEMLRRDVRVSSYSRD